MSASHANWSPWSQSESPSRRRERESFVTEQHERRGQRERESAAHRGVPANKAAAVPQFSIGQLMDAMLSAKGNTRPPPMALSENPTCTRRVSSSPTRVVHRSPMRTRVLHQAEVASPVRISHSSGSSAGVSTFTRVYGGRVERPEIIYSSAAPERPLSRSAGSPSRVVLRRADGVEEHSITHRPTSDGQVSSVQLAYPAQQPYAGPLPIVGHPHLISASMQPSVPPQVPVVRHEADWAAIPFHLRPLCTSHQPPTVQRPPAMQQPPAVQRPPAVQQPPPIGPRCSPPALDPAVVRYEADWAAIPLHQRPPAAPTKAFVSSDPSGRGAPNMSKMSKPRWYYDELGFYQLGGAEVALDEAYFAGYEEGYELACLHAGGSYYRHTEAKSKALVGQPKNNSAVQ